MTEVFVFNWIIIFCFLEYMEHQVTIIERGNVSDNKITLKVKILS